MSSYQASLVFHLIQKAKKKELFLDSGIAPAKYSEGLIYD